MRVTFLAVAILPVVAACGASPSSPSQPVSVTPAAVKLFAGDTTRLRTADGGAVRWHSAAPAVATVDPAGLVAALTPGVAAVWATRGADSAAASVEVSGAKCLLGILMTPSNAILAPGDTIRVDARAGCVSAPVGFTWSSGDTAVALVNEDPSNAGRSAVVTARGNGQVIIVATLLSDPTVNATMALTVRTP